MVYNQNVAKFLVDDFEKDYKIEKKKLIIDVIIIIIVYNAFIFQIVRKKMKNKLWVFGDFFVWHHEH
jgi:hypothetical protein